MRLICLVLFANALFGQTYTASALAGVWLPENLPGASVSLDQIGGVAVDAAGNVFLSLPRYAAVPRGIVRPRDGNIRRHREPF